MKSEIDIFKALGDENRIRIAMMLRERPMCVCEIDSLLEIALSTVSSHLKILKKAGIIKDIKDGRWIIYSIDSANTFALELMESFAKKRLSDNVFKRDKLRLDALPESICSKYRYAYFEPKSFSGDSS
jgi:ArsR family transcriptional regulator